VGESRGWSGCSTHRWVWITTLVLFFGAFVWEFVWFLVSEWLFVHIG
jgi:hypothetical protein